MRRSTADRARLEGPYRLTSHFRLVRRPNENGVVEASIGFARRDSLEPDPRAPNFATPHAQSTGGAGWAAPKAPPDLAEPVAASRPPAYLPNLSAPRSSAGSHNRKALAAKDKQQKPAK